MQQTRSKKQAISASCLAAAAAWAIACADAGSPLGPREARVEEQRPSPSFIALWVPTDSGPQLAVASEMQGGRLLLTDPKHRPNAAERARAGSLRTRINTVTAIAA